MADFGTRTDPPGRAGERETLLGFLRYQRETLALKCAGLTPEQAARRAVEPSSMSLLGLVRHLADVERGWIRGRIAGDVAEPLFWREDRPDAAFDEAEGTAACVEEAWAALRESAAFTERFAAGASLDRTCEDRRGLVSLRWVLFHLIEEYARHNGHADLLRERIDGSVGQ
ncbi:DinB family protein [Glycomyces sp. MUSA5-2]|uniref:DinB family protein n=1 Tax=Glycomyces sp. MUSA5-2 TaxID=2053002 RepID=UPI0030087269